MKKFISILFMLTLGVSLPCMAQATKEHVVNIGETFQSIAAKYGITEQQLKDLNPKNRGVFYVGMKLNVPKDTKAAKPAAPVLATKRDKKAEAKAKKEEARAKKEAKVKEKNSSKKGKSASTADKDAAKAKKEAAKTEKAAARKAKAEERKAARKAKTEERKAARKAKAEARKAKKKK